VGFDGRVELARVGECELTEVVTQPIRYVRTSRHVKIGQRDDIFLSLTTSGLTRFTQNERRVTQGPGDVVVFDTAYPYEFDYPEPFSLILLRVPRPLMDSRFPCDRDFGGRRLSAQQPHGRIVASILRNLVELARGDELSPGFMVPALDIIARSLAQGAGMEYPEGRNQDLLLRRVKRFIIDHIADDDMSLERISSEQNISVRSISRFFAQEGTTPMAWLQKKRLAVAYALLAEGRSNSVTQVAFDCGFKDLSHFGRSFKTTYGVTPRQVMLRRTLGPTEIQAS
jgi:AraC-like DNA-binding protein